MNFKDLIFNYNLMIICLVGDGIVKLFFKIKVYFLLLFKRIIEIGMYSIKVNIFFVIIL